MVHLDHIYCIYVQYYESAIYIVLTYNFITLSQLSHVHSLDVKGETCSQQEGYPIGPWSTFVFDV